MRADNVRENWRLDALIGIASNPLRVKEFLRDLLSLSFKLRSFLLLVIMHKLHMLSQLNSELTAHFLFKRNWIWSDHADLGLVRHSLSTLLWWCFLRLLFFLRWIWVFIVWTLVDHLELEFDFFRLSVRLTFKENLLESVLCLFFFSKWCIFFYSFIFFGFGIYNNLLFDLGRFQLEKHLICLQSCNIVLKSTLQ